MRRYFEFDVARTIVLILLPLSHIVDMIRFFDMANDSVILQFTTIEKIAPFGVVIFMLCMGINLNITRHNTARDFIRRGNILFCASVGLNVVRSIIPGVMYLIITGDMGMLFSALSLMVASDILYFAAFAFYFFALARRLSLSPVTVIAISACLSLLDKYIINLNGIENQFAVNILGNFIYMDAHSSFAFCQWLIVPAIGYAFGHRLMKKTTKEGISQYWKKTIIVASTSLIILILILIVSKLSFLDISGSQYESFNFELLGALIYVSFAFICMSIVYRICSNKDESGRGVRFFIRFSENITYYYIIQWVIIVWTTGIAYVFGVYFENSLACACTILPYYLATVYISSALSNKISKRVSRKK